jgi:hypothetical protein
LFGTPELIATIPSTYGGDGGGLSNYGAGSIAVDSDSAYVASADWGPVFRVALDGSGATDLEVPSSNNLAVDATQVYTVSGDYTSASGDPYQALDLVVACAKTGCRGDYTTLASGQHGAFDIAIDDTSVYWAGPSPIGVTKAARSGGVPTRLTPGLDSDALVLAGGMVFFAGSPSASEITSLMSVPVSGGPVSTLFNPDPGLSVGPLASDSQFVYFAVEDGRIGKVPIAGGPVTMLATLFDVIACCQIAVDASYVYVAQLDGIYAVPLAGGTPTLVISTSLAAWAGGIAVDARALYWTTAHTVMRAARK